MQWIRDVCHATNKEPEVLPLSVYIFDRFMGKMISNGVPDQFLLDAQLYAATAMFVSSKLRDFDAFTADQLVDYTDHIGRSN